MKHIQARGARPRSMPTVIDTLETRDGLASRLPRWHSFDGLRSRMTPPWAVFTLAPVARSVTPPSSTRRPRVRKSAGAHSS